MQEKYQEQTRDLYMAFIDLSKGFNSINSEALWKCLSIFGWPVNFITILRLLYDKMTAENLNQRNWNRVFHHQYRGETGMGYRTDCLHYLPTYSFLSVINFRVDWNWPPGRWETFHPSRLKVKTKVINIAVIDLQYTDDRAILAHTKVELQTSLEFLMGAYQSLRLSIDIRKTKIIFQLAPGNNERPPDIKISGTTI